MRYKSKLSNCTNVAVIRLDLSRAQRYNLFYTEHCHVVVQGEKIGDCFHVQVYSLLYSSEFFS